MSEPISKERILEDPTNHILYYADQDRSVVLKPVNNIIKRSKAITYDLHISFEDYNEMVKEIKGGSVNGIFPLQEMKIIGMASYDKLMTLKMLQNNTGPNQQLSYSGLESDQTRKNFTKLKSNMDCLEIIIDNDSIKLMYKSELSEKNFKNTTTGSLKLLQDLDNLKRKLNSDLAKLLADNFIQFESIAAEKDNTIEVCTLDV
ncbi:hypothetical protein BpHYR1_015466 [Brachionus plicatilis]|uniref:Uncharacterized protein n=1 Tax=Brachionus plicatilis TaxID=10195 RepID=A0A3M7R4H5_BRAPC|nr:hypothetical protein BpHYR1_015466 [Brachionus plicatilis]